MAGFDEAGLEAAFSQADEGLRYPLSTASPLAHLKLEFAHSRNHIRKIDELVRRGYTMRRRVRGDGNCFYRAVGVAWLEGLVARAHHQSEDFFPWKWPRELCFDHLIPEGEDLQRAINHLLQPGPLSDAGEVGDVLFRRLLGDMRFDLCMVTLVRHLVADYLLQSADDSDVRVIVAAQHGSVEEFVTKQVLPLGQEAEGASILAASCQLGIKLLIFQLDGSPDALSMYSYPSEDHESPLGFTISLLFRPGHYELCYHSSAIRFHEAAEFVGKCSCCQECSPLQSNSLLECYHRACFNCCHRARNLYPSEKNEPCLICLGASLPRRPLSSPATSRSLRSRPLKTDNGASPQRCLRPRSRPHAKATSHLDRLRGSWVSTDEASTPPVFGRAASSGTVRTIKRAEPKEPDSDVVKQPAYCENGCGFFGSPQTAGMCSKCFAELGIELGFGPPVARTKPLMPQRQIENFYCEACDFTCGTKLRLNKHKRQCPRRLDRLGDAPDSARSQTSTDDRRLPPRKMISRSLVEQYGGWVSALDSPHSNVMSVGVECLGCTCGYTCGTSKALQKHLARFPDDPSHQAGIFEEFPDVLHERSQAQDLLLADKDETTDSPDWFHDDAVNSTSPTLPSAGSTLSSQPMPVPPPASEPLPWTLDLQGCVVCHSSASYTGLKVLHCGARVHTRCLKDFWLAKVVDLGRLTCVDCPAQESGCCETLTHSDLTGVLEESDMFSAWSQLQHMAEGRKDGKVLQVF